MNLLALRTQVRFNINRSADAFPDDTIDVAINWSLRSISELHTFSEMRKTYEGTLTVDSFTYNYPTRLKEVFDIRIYTSSNYRKLHFVDPRHFDTEIPYPLNSGIPTWWVGYGNYFEIYAKPDSAYTTRMRCSIFPPDLETDTATPLLVGKDSMIVTFATTHCWMMLKEYEYADKWSQFAINLLEAAKQGDKGEDDWVPVARGFNPSTVGLDYTNPFS